MRLARVRCGDRNLVAVRASDGFRETSFSTVEQVIHAGNKGRVELAIAAREGVFVDPDAVLAPMVHPPKMLFCGVNYEDHLAEIPEMVRPVEPFFFSKLPSSITGPNAPILVPSESIGVDYEAELAVVIGATASGVDERDALGYVFGYTVVNDVSARLIQFTDSQITLGKGLDTFCPMGPELVLVDEIPDPGQLGVRCTVNGEVRQASNTSQLIYSVSELIAYLSRTVTLHPGDVIATGTPAGVGHAKKPPLYLRDGDVVEVEVDGIGRLSNTVAVISES